MTQEICTILLCAAIIQLLGAYIRYLPFWHVVDGRQRRRFLRGACLCCVLNAIWMGWILFAKGVTIPAYKLIFGIGWIPYFAMSLWVIRGYPAQQIFILGMQGICSMLLHSLAALAPLLLMNYMEREDLIAYQLFSHVILSVLTLPLLRVVFRGLLPSKQFINEKPYSYYIAFLPILLVLSQSPVSVNPGSLWGPERLVTRLVLMVCFLALWRYIVLERKDMEDQVQLESPRNLMQKAIRFFRHAELLNQERLKEMSIFRHDARHHMRTLYALAYDGKTEEIMALLNSLDEELQKTAVHPYCLNPILNAVVSIYFARAQEAGITLTQKFVLPESMPGLENDLAFFTANLLENAINAALTMPEGQRTLTVKYVASGPQLALSVANSYAGTLTLDKEGYPTASTYENGHGTGMVSIARFVDKYHAVKNYSQKGKIVRFTAYLVQG